MEITLEVWQRALARTLGVARLDGKKPVCLCAADDSGCLLGLARMDGAPRRVAAIASAKAHTAARMGCSTADLKKRMQAEGLSLADFCDEQFTSLPGGIPIHSGALCLGAVGVSGRSMDEDQELAMIFAQFLRESLES